MKRFFSIVLIVLACVGCGQSPKKGKPIVLVSIEPHVEMVRQIAGESVDIYCIVPAGVDPHNWEPTIKHMTKLQHASVWFCIGESFEGTLLKKLRKCNTSLKKVDLFQNIKRLPNPSEHCKSCLDTHIWLSPTLDIIQAETITTVLADMLPEQKEMFGNHLKQLTKDLHTLHQKLKEEMAPFAGKILLTTHGAYTYFCKDFGLQQLIIEPSEGKEPKTRDIADLAQKIEQEKQNIIGVFLQPQHTNKAALLLAKNLKFPSYTVDPYQRNYIKTMEQLRDDIRKTHH